jgi:polysaccharide deacetylase family protein (PEP-CTERM system associated)
MTGTINGLSIDLEDWYHAELIRKHTALKKIGSIQNSTNILLNLLNKYNAKATFFIVGEIAATYPALVKKIYKSGHEIACHGFSHKILHELGPDGLRRELTEFQKVVIRTLGNIEINGFRAPTFSLTQETAWAVDILKEYKFKYDSSIFPIKINNFYGINRAPLNIYGLNAEDIKVPDAKSTLKEFPITVFEIYNFRFPISGGFYLRLIPIYLQKKVLKLVNKNRPFILYTHPWECDNTIPRVKLNALSSFISYYNIKSTLTKLEYLLQNFNFDRIDNIIGV